MPFRPAACGDSSEGEVHLLAKASLGSNGMRVANDEHPDHQLGIDRRAAALAVERSQLLADLREVHELVDRPQQVVRRHIDPANSGLFRKARDC